MFIFLDTNALYRDPRMASARLRLLLEGARTIGATVILPAVVVEELRRQAREDLESSSSSIKEATLKLNRLAGYTALHLPEATLEATISADLDRWFEVLATQAEVRVAPCPTVPHSDLALRAIQKKRPFQDKGRGYVDALIWFSIVEQLGASPTKTVFITSNTKDFASADGSLHEDLVEDLKRRNCDPALLEMLSSVDAFNKKHVLPHLKPAAKLMFELEEEAHAKFNVRLWASDHLGPAIVPEYLLDAAIEHGAIDEGVDVVKKVHVLEVYKPHVRNAFELRDGKFSVRVTIPCRLSFAIEYAPKSIRAQRGRHGPMEMIHLPMREHEYTENVTVDVSMILDANVTRVLAADVMGMEGRFGEMEVEIDDDEDDEGDHEGAG